jgi:excisionase family DNA binding protein
MDGVAQVNLISVPRINDLVVDPDKAAFLPAESIPPMLGELERLKATLWARLTSRQNDRQAGGQVDGDRLLSAKEAAAKLGTSADYLYRHSRNLSFTVRLGRKLRFSEAGIERYIRQRMGR